VDALTARVTILESTCFGSLPVSVGSLNNSLSALSSASAASTSQLSSRVSALELSASSATSSAIASVTNASSSFVVGQLVPFALRSAPSRSWLQCDGSNVSRALYPQLFAAIAPLVGTVIISANVSVNVTRNGTVVTPAIAFFIVQNHGFVIGDSLFLTTNGMLPSGVQANFQYFVRTTSATNLTLSATRGGSAVFQFSTNQTGPHFLWACPYGMGDGFSTFSLPDLRGATVLGAGTSAFASGATKHLLGQKGGEESHLLLSSESGFPGGASSTGTTSDASWLVSPSASIDTYPTGTATQSFASSCSGADVGCNYDDIYSSIKSSFFAHTHSVSIPASNASMSHNTLPTFQTANWMIYAGVPLGDASVTAAQSGGTAPQSPLDTFSSSLSTLQSRVSALESSTVSVSLPVFGSLDLIDTTADFTETTRNSYFVPRSSPVVTVGASGPYTVQATGRLNGLASGDSYWILQLRVTHNGTPGALCSVISDVPSAQGSGSTIISRGQTQNLTDDYLVLK
jgi:microcystin-dependent protein